ncbi:hypothetical protein PIB30_091501 [Stylosanthes scabra]|uniref:Uncharacterized protein n=1 Tax=Stylosanthes scabra TaxID=79078 RepID=A0ABU6VT38_9FABA|nr:hypothetical protein [Stylosanthes scabra]
MPRRSLQEMNPLPAELPADFCMILAVFEVTGGFTGGFFPPVKMAVIPPESIGVGCVKRRLQHKAASTAMVGTSERWCGPMVLPEGWVTGCLPFFSHTLNNKVGGEKRREIGLGTVEDNHAKTDSSSYSAASMAERRRRRGGVA